MKIDKKVAICSPGVDEHTMLHIVRHPDGSIYVNAHKLGLFRSDDQGETWKQIPLKLPDAPPDQDPGGFGITRDGHLTAASRGKPARWISDASPPAVLATPTLQPASTGATSTSSSGPMGP